MSACGAFQKSLAALMLQCMSLEVALFSRQEFVPRCPLLGVKRSWIFSDPRAVVDPFQTFGANEKAALSTASQHL